MTRTLTADERTLMTHVSRFGSDGYPVRKLRAGRWIVDAFLTVKGPPTVFRTKREAVAAFERFFDVLLELNREERHAQALAEQAAREGAR